VRKFLQAEAANDQTIPILMYENSLCQAALGTPNVKSRFRTIIVFHFMLLGMAYGIEVRATG
jgi:hypothetical protein